MFKIKFHGGKGMTYKQAAIQAKAETDAVRQQEISGGKQEVVEEAEFAGSQKS
jgi:hypothetical protein